MGEPRRVVDASNISSMSDMELQQSQEQHQQQPVFVAPKLKKSFSCSLLSSEDEKDKLFPPKSRKRTGITSNNKQQKSTGRSGAKCDPLGDFLAGQQRQQQPSFNSNSSRHSLDDSQSYTSELSREAHSTHGGLCKSLKTRRKGGRRKDNDDIVNLYSAAELESFMDQDLASSKQRDVEVRSLCSASEAATCKKTLPGSTPLRQPRTAIARKAESQAVKSSSARVGKKSADLVTSPMCSANRNHADLQNQRSRSRRRSSIRSSHTSTTTSTTNSQSPPTTPSTPSCQSLSSTSQRDHSVAPPAPFLQVLYPSIQRRMSNPTIQEFTARQLHQGGTAMMAMVTNNKVQQQVPRAKSTKKKLGRKKLNCTSIKKESLPNSSSHISDSRIPMTQSPHDAVYKVVFWDMEEAEERIAQEQRGEEEELDDLGLPLDIFTFYSWSSRGIRKGHCDPPTLEATRLARAFLQQSVRNNPLHEAMANMALVQ